MDNLFLADLKGVYTGQFISMAVIAFVHIEKTAGKAIKHQLRRALGLGHCDVKRWREDADYFSAADLRRLLWVYPRLCSIAGHSIKAYSDLKAGFSSLQYYTFLRDPIQRSISHYQYRMNLGSINCSFEDWIRDESNHDWQVRTLAGAPDLERALDMLDHDISFIGLQERLDESLALMHRALNLNHVISSASERVNAAKSSSIRDEILRDTRNLRLLQRANRLDIELYRYAETVIYPRQQRAFGSAPENLRNASSFWSRYSHGYCSNVIYRELVYKPIVWLYRRNARGLT
ncbi:MAG: sulfotransferase family 2 domain-containing protein [Nitrococcus sp.]|nr:sulfotransferase family 2 domain-containing protein [Nitrococcus sp.]